MPVSILFDSSNTKQLIGSLEKPIATFTTVVVNKWSKIGWMVEKSKNKFFIGV